MPNTPDTLARATAGQLRRAGFVVDPASTDDSATAGFEVLTNHSDPPSVAEYEKAKKRGDHMPRTSPASSQPTPTVT